KDFLKNLAKSAKNRGFSVNFGVDIIGNLAETGNWFHNMNEDLEIMQRLFLYSENVISINATIYQNAGATMIQQLAYSLAHLNEYFTKYSESISNQIINFKFSVGSNYFFEIAKLRAFRLLFNTLASEYDLKVTITLTAIPSLRNKVIYDYNTNLLRTTTECMSAILGGANTVLNLPYDVLYHKTNEFGQRISRNQLLILKEESYFEAQNNPAEGSYYIESLTDQLAEKALTLFKQIEAEGGFLKLLKYGNIQRKIKESAQKEQDAFDSGNKILLGINKHPNPDDRMKDDIELYPFIKKNARKTLIEPIISKRLAENQEKKRLNNE
ncbi:MAG: methylmalonyl-CoA mutase family protein, partial [Leeuwenhoekiella sp.]